MKRVLFVCRENRARGQMAEGLLRHLAGDRFQACSAGTEPKGVAPMTVEVMEGIGIDIRRPRSQSVEDPAEAEAREEQSRQAFSAARDDLRTRIEGFLGQEVVEGGAASG